MIQFMSQAEAVEVAREAIWGQTGTRGIQSAPFHVLREDPRFDTPKGYFAAYVTAQVNKRDVIIEFDTFGRATVQVVR